MAACAIFGLGCPSATTTSITNNTQLNTTVFNFLQTNQTTSSVGVNTDQVLNISKVKAIGCQLSITQDVKVTTSQIQQFTSQSSQQLQQAISTVLQNQANTAASSKTDFLSQASQSTDNTTINNLITTTVQQTIDMKTLNNMVTEINNKQTSNVSEVTMDPCGMTLYPNGPPQWVMQSCNPNLPCPISQNIAITALSTQIVNVVANAILGNTGFSNVYNETKASSSVVNTGALQGIGGIFSSIFGGIFGGIQGIMSGQSGMVSSSCIICIVIIMIIAGFGYLETKKGGGLPK